METTKTMRPLDGVEGLAGGPGKQILLFETKKTAAAARELFGDAILVLACHGTTPAEIQSIDFSPLAGRKVVIWPANHLPGISAAEKIWAALETVCKGARIVLPPENLPVGWSLADGVRTGWTLENTVIYLKANLLDPETEAGAGSLARKKSELDLIGKKSVREETEPPPLADEFCEPDRLPEVLEEGGSSQGNQFLADKYPFRCLGYDGIIFYYLPDGSQQIIKLRADQHDEKNITALLAPIDFWEKYWTGKRRVKDASGEWQEQNSGVDWKAIRRFLIWEIQYKKGVYMGDENIRGLGVWKDSQRMIVHLGDCLMVDGKKYMMSRIPSKYIYEKKRAVEAEVFEPLDLAGANQIIDLVEKFRWNRAINARLVVGWITAALIGGSLPWRPHIWINGPQACGKSSLLKDIVRRVLGNCVAIFIEGATTEAGLRQQANHCSFPILFDEAESNDRKGQVRMEQIIELMRSSASPDGGKIVKGSSGGSAMTFDIQSCFCLASISNNSYLAADVARIVNLELNQNDGSGEKWEVFRQRILDTLNPEWCGRFRARVFKMVPTIRKNIDVFIRAVRDELDSQRYGDVYGVLLGSAYSYFSDKTIDYDAARAWVRERDWTEERRLRHESDDTKCLVRIMERIVTIKQEGLNEEKTLWEIVRAIEEHEQRPPNFYPDFNSPEAMAEIKIKAMADTARRYGIIYRQDAGQKWVVVDNHNSYIRVWLKDTQYIPNWSKFLKRIKERIGETIYEARVSGPRRTAENTSTRGVMIPFEVVEFFMEQDDETPNAKEA